MVADLVDEDMAHEVVEILAGLAPVIEDGAAVEKDDVGLGACVHHALARQRDAAIEAENVERAVELHLLLGLGIGKFLDANDDAPEMPLQRRRYGGQPALGQRLEVGQRRRHARHPAHRRAPARRLISAARSATCRRGEPISGGEGWSRDWRGGPPQGRFGNFIAGAAQRDHQPPPRAFNSAPYTPPRASLNTPPYP